MSDLLFVVALMILLVLIAGFAIVIDLLHCIHVAICPNNRASAPTLPQVTPEDAREWLLSTWMPRQASHVKAWLTALSAATSLTEIAEMLAEFASRPPAAAEKEK